MLALETKYLLELEVNGNVGATDAVEGEEGNGEERGGDAGPVGERGRVAVKNNWTLWCWRI